MGTEAVHATAERLLGQGSVLTSLAVTRGDLLDAIDPRILRILPAFGDAPVVWVVRGAGRGPSPVVRTFLIDERAPLTVFELTRQGIERR
jgi:hypothetical protein